MVSSDQLTPDVAKLLEAVRQDLAAADTEQRKTTATAKSKRKSTTAAGKSRRKPTAANDKTKGEATEVPPKKYPNLLASEWPGLTDKKRRDRLQSWVQASLSHWKLPDNGNRLDTMDTRWHEIKHLRAPSELVLEIDCRRFHGSGVPVSYSFGYQRLAQEYLEGGTFKLPTARFGAQPSQFDLSLGLIPGKVRTLPGRLYQSTWEDHYMGQGPGWVKPLVKKSQEPSFLVMNDANKAPNLLVWCTTEGQTLTQDALERNSRTRELLRRDDIAQRCFRTFHSGGLFHSELYLILDVALTRHNGYWR